MNILERLRADVLSLFPEVEAELDPQVARARGRLLQESRERLALGRYHVVVCGEFRRGKSSLLNALVDRPGLFPVDVAVTTSAVTTLRYAEEEHAVVYFTDAQTEEIPQSAAAEYVTEQQNKNNVKNVERIEMAAPIPQLKSGLVLVDTPGVGSLNVAHTAATRAFLPNADAILFVAMVTEPLGTVELEFLKTALEHCPIVVTAITMIDREPDPAPMIEQARARIAEATGRAADDLVIVGVSSLRKRAAVLNDDPISLEESGFPELERALWHGITITCGRAQLERGLDAIEEALTETAAPVANALAALNDDDSLHRIDAEIRAAQEAAKANSAKNSRWRGKLHADLELKARPIRNDLRRDFDMIADEFRAALRSPRALSDPDSLVREVADGLVDAAQRATRRLLERVEQLAAEYSVMTSTPVLAGDVSAGGSPVPVTPDIRMPVSEERKSAKWGRFRSVWGGGVAGAGAGALIGFGVGLAVPVIGPFIGPVVGSVIGQIVGWFAGNREARQREDERARREYLARLQTDVTTMISRTTRQIEQDLTHRLVDCERAMVSALEEQIDAQSQSQQETIRELNRVKRQTALEREERAAELKIRADRYTALFTRINALRRRAEGLGGTAQGDM